MKMSAACTAPTQPVSTDADCAHPRYREYRDYRQALTLQLVTAMSFKAWLRSKEQHENGHEVVYEVASRTAMLARGWYKNVFDPGEREPRILGPFPTQQQAQMS
jgi:hypothetical protein